MTTWIPACVVVAEHCKLTTLSPVNFITRKIIRPLRALGDKVTVGFTTSLTKLVLHLRWFWLVSLGITAVACCGVVFYYPGLQLPDYMDFQLFHDTHPFEQYDLVYSRRFWFERYEMVPISHLFYRCICITNVYNIYLIRAGWWRCSSFTIKICVGH